MAATIYHDSVGTYDASITTLNDGGGSGTFIDSDSLTNEERAIDEDITQVIGGWANSEGLQFDFSGAVTVDFCAIYSTVATSNDVRVYRDDAASGTFGSSNILSDVAVGWNIRTLSSSGAGGSYRYRSVWATTGDLTGIAEIFFGVAIDITPTANVITQHKFGTEEVKAHGANRYYISKHDNYKVLTVSLDHISASTKTSLETFSSNATDRKPFIYSEDGATGPFHWVRLMRPLTFKMVAPDIWSCQMVMRELIA